MCLFEALSRGIILEGRGAVQLAGELLRGHEKAAENWLVLFSSQQLYEWGKSEVIMSIMMKHIRKPWFETTETYPSTEMTDEFESVFTVWPLFERGRRTNLHQIGDHPITKK
jgi:hypothetical protein